MERTGQSGIKLRLHLGPEKTGTSFLQCLSVANRGLLAERGIHFPTGTPHDERCMRDGRISAGNGRILARLVEDEDWQAVQGWIACAVEACSQNACSELLISSEQLLAPLAGPGLLGHFLKSVRSAGISEISLLLILRDPVSQLLSLYKHRAKGGSAGRIGDWVESGYLLPNHLGELRRQLEPTDVELCVRAYSREPGGLARLFFRDWLELGEKIDGAAAEVNPSLSLSELELLRLLHARRPELVPFFYEALLVVPRADKVQGRALEDHARAVAENAVWQHREEWQRWNALLPEGEALSLPERPPDIPAYPAELGFSEQQLECLAEFLSEAASFRFLLRLIWRSRIRPGLGRIARAVGVRGFRVRGSGFRG